MFPTFYRAVLILSLATLTIQHSPTSSCGIRRKNFKELIWYATDAYGGQFPWHVAVLHQQPGKFPKYQCGGSLIGKRFVVTSGHCVKVPADRIVVQVGAHQQNDFKLGMNNLLRVEKIHKVDSGEWTDLHNDIAILELDRNVNYTKLVQPICIDPIDVAIGSNGVVVGWGITENNTLAETLKYGRMPIIDPLDCLASNRQGFADLLDSSLFCAGNTIGANVCSGDSGGGFYTERNGTWFLTGIVSFAPEDSEGRLCQNYAAFTKVFKYLSWITSVAELSSGGSGSLEKVIYKNEPEFVELFIIVDPMQCHPDRPSRFCHMNFFKDVSNYMNHATVPLNMFFPIVGVTVLDIATRARIINSKATSVLGSLRELITNSSLKQKIKFRVAIFVAYARDYGSNRLAFAAPRTLCGPEDVVMLVTFNEELYFPEELARIILGQLGQLSGMGDEFPISASWHAKFSPESIERFQQARQEGLFWCASSIPPRPFEALCGNGKVEVGEACDCGNGYVRRCDVRSCDPLTCQSRF